MKEALFWQKIKDKIRCNLCPRYCLIEENNKGFCGVRKNINDKLYSLVYGKAIARAIDPIEKKPLFHFYPASKIYSFGTVGCNFACLHCQNYEISQARYLAEVNFGIELEPEKIVEEAKNNDCIGIAYTYTEPTIFYEYMYDTAKIARKQGLKNVIVSNGYINEEPLRKLAKVIDAANIDLKAFDDEFYKEVCGNARLEPVLKTLKILKEENVWLEITNLIIPTYNDDLNKISEMIDWIIENLGKSIPLHFTRFFPFYKLAYLPETSVEILKKARELALSKEMKYVYIGNVLIEGAEDTYCPSCGKKLIKRMGFTVSENNIVNGKCKFCNAKIEGIF